MKDLFKSFGYNLILPFLLAGRAFESLFSVFSRQKIDTPEIALKYDSFFYVGLSEDEEREAEEQREIAKRNAIHIAKMKKEKRASEKIREAKEAYRAKEDYRYRGYGYNKDKPVFTYNEKTDKVDVTNPADDLRRELGHLADKIHDDDHKMFKKENIERMEAIQSELYYKYHDANYGYVSSRRRNF
jgi:hypothetical protein